MSREWPRCSATGWSRCTRTSTVGYSPTSTTPSTSPTSSGMASTDRPRRVEPLPVRRSSHSRRSTSAAPRWSAPGEEPRTRRRRRRSPTTSWCSKSSAAKVRSRSTRGGRRRGRRSRTCRVRLGHLRLARRQRRGATGDVVTDARSRAGAGLRREPPPSRRSLPLPRSRELVGPRGAARRQGALVSQPLRRRGRVATRAPAGWSARGGDPEACEPLWRRGSGRHLRGVHRGARVRRSPAFGGIVALNRPVPDSLAPRPRTGLHRGRRRTFLQRCRPRRR